jgi:hypothetical protein
MQPVNTPSESIEEFFARYTGYLTAGDIEELAAIYNYPSLAVTAMGCLAITDPQQSRDFFTQGQHYYRSRGIQGVRARDIVTDVEVPGIWVGRLVLENLDDSGAGWAWNVMPTKWLPPRMERAVSPYLRRSMRTNPIRQASRHRYRPRRARGGLLSLYRSVWIGVSAHKSTKIGTSCS